MISLRRLRYFVAVAEELHFGRAAARLNISQPPLTQQIQTLELELGVKLFDRNTRRVQLTDAGRVLLERSRVLLPEAERTVMATREMASGQSAHLEIGYAPPADLRILPHIIPKFRQHHPAVRLVLKSLAGPALIEGLKTERIRAAILRSPVNEPGLSCVRLISERLVAVLPEGHHLAAKRSVRFADLGGEEILFFPRWLSPAYFDTVARLCLEKGGFVFSPSQEVETSQTTIALVAAGLGITLQSESIHLLNRRGIAYVAISDSPACVEMSLAYRTSDDSSVLRKLITIVDEFPLPRSI
jgi:DNA-binding transcriptional LysR family regulator